MKIVKLALTYLLCNGLFFISVRAQDVTFSMVEIEKNVVALRMCANVNLTTPPTGSRWSTGTFFIRLANIDPNAVFTTGTSITDNFTDGFGGLDLSRSHGPVPISGLPNAAGCHDIIDGNGDIFLRYLDAVSATGVDNPLTAGQCVDLVTMTFPGDFSCPDCVQLVQADFLCSTTAENPFVGNSRPGFSFNIGDATANLPIELTAFETRTNACDVSLYWETATEQNFGYYQIEASRDGRGFEAIAQQKPASPNSLTPRQYKYAVPQKYQGHYFRLRAVDLDNSFEFSPVVFAEAPCEQDEKYSMKLYPNPNYTSELMVEVYSPQVAENVQLHLSDAFGKLIRIQKTNLEVGVNKIPIETADLPSGNYYIKVIGVAQLIEPIKFVRSNF